MICGHIDAWTGLPRGCANIGNFAVVVVVVVEVAVRGGRETVRSLNGKFVDVNCMYR